MGMFFFQVIFLKENQDNVSIYYVAGSFGYDES
jgi:hypothetical protein